VRRICRSLSASCLHAEQFSMRRMIVFLRRAPISSKTKRERHRLVGCLASTAVGSLGDCNSTLVDVVCLKSISLRKRSSTAISRASFVSYLDLVLRRKAQPRGLSCVISPCALKCSHLYSANPTPITVALQMQNVFACVRRRRR